MRWHCTKHLFAARSPLLISIFLSVCKSRGCDFVMLKIPVHWVGARCSFAFIRSTLIHAVLTICACVWHLLHSLRYTLLLFAGGEENLVQLGPYKLCFKVYTMDRRNPKIGTAYPVRMIAKPPASQPASHLLSQP